MKSRLLCVRMSCFLFDAGDVKTDTEKQSEEKDKAAKKKELEKIAEKAV